MAEFVQGYRDVYGKIHTTEEEADDKNRIYNLHQEMYNFMNTHKIVPYPRDFEVAEYIIRNYDQIKIIMDKHGQT